MALSYPIGRRYRVTPTDDGKFPTLGNVSDAEGGAWSIQFVPDATFVGSFGVVARSAGKDTNDDEVGFGSVRYRRVQLDGVASDYALVDDVLTTDFIILVPASGLSVALLTECTAGFGYLYTKPLAGDALI